MLRHWLGQVVERHRIWSVYTHSVANPIGWHINERRWRANDAYGVLLLKDGGLNHAESRGCHEERDEKTGLQGSSQHDCRWAF